MYGRRPTASDSWTHVWFTGSNLTTAKRCNILAVLSGAELGNGICATRCSGQLRSDGTQAGCAEHATERGIDHACRTSYPTRLWAPRGLVLCSRLLCEWYITRTWLRPSRDAACSESQQLDWVNFTRPCAACDASCSPVLLLADIVAIPSRQPSAAMSSASSK